jgi:hypothetical protein
MADLADTVIDIPADEPAPDVVIDLTPETPKVEAPKKEPKPKTIVQPEEGLEKLKQQLEDERKQKADESRLRQAAEARATTAEQTAATAQGHAQDSELTTVTTGLAHVKQLREGLRRSWADASAAGDHTKMAEVQDEMAEAAANQKMFERAEQELKTRPKPAPVITDPVEILAAKLSPRSASWLRSHPDHATGNKYQKMIAAHQLALADGISPDTDEYFESIEGTLKLRQPEATHTEPDIHIDTTPQKATGGRSAAPAAAPVSRSGTGNGSRPKSYTLTAAQQEAAKISGMTNQEYAMQQMEIDEEKRRMN